MKIKHVLGLHTNTTLFPDYPMADDIVAKLESTDGIETKKLSEKYLHSIIQNEDKYDSLISELIKTGYLVKKTSNDKIFYNFVKIGKL